MRFLLLSLLLVVGCNGFVVQQPALPTPQRHQLCQLSASRREILSGAATMLPLLISRTAQASEIDEAFDNVRDEARKGVQFLREKLDQNEFRDVFEFTQTYDIVLRKVKMGKARKLIDDKTATEKANAITWDLIGVNRNVRPGQENRAEAVKYVDELERDIQTFLELRPRT